MAPQTRSATKPTSGRTTRNSTYGRPSLPPPVTQPRATTIQSSADSPSDSGPQVEASVAPVVDNPSKDMDTWLTCRDSDGFATTVALSKTGEGIHMRWRYSGNDYDHDPEVDEQDAAEVEMLVDEDHDTITPPATGGGTGGITLTFPETPMALDPRDAGSVILTPVKKARPLQPSPQRIGDKGIRCLYRDGSVLRKLNDTRFVLRQPMGSSVNMSRVQIEALEKGKADEIAITHVGRLLDEGQKAREEAMAHHSESDRPDDDLKANSDSALFDTEMLVSLEDLDTDTESGYFRGPNGQLLNQHGRPMFGPDGTVLIDSTNAKPKSIMRQDAFLIESEWEKTEHPNRCRPRLGPCGTQLID